MHALPWQEILGIGFFIFLVYLFSQSGDSDTDSTEKKQQPPKTAPVTDSPVYQLSKKTPFGLPENHRKACHTTGFINTDGLNIRKTNNFNQVLVKLPLAHQVCILGTVDINPADYGHPTFTKKWIRLTFDNGLSGDAALKYVTIRKSYKVNTQRINLRESIDTHNKKNVIREIPEGEVLYLVRKRIKKQNNKKSIWFLVVTNKSPTLGWVNSRNLKAIP